MINAKLLLPLAFCAGLMGCSSSSTPSNVNVMLHYITTDSAPEQTVDRYAQAALTEAATTANHSLQRLSSLEMAKNKHIRMPTLPNADALKLAQHTSLNWTGPAAPLLEKLANAGGYHFSIIGKKPLTPALVSINEQDKTLASLIRNVQYQIVNKATIAIYRKQKVIELRYHSY